MARVSRILLYLGPVPTAVLWDRWFLTQAATMQKHKNRHPGPLPSDGRGRSHSSEGNDHQSGNVLALTKVSPSPWGEGERLFQLNGYGLA